MTPWVYSLAYTLPATVVIGYWLGGACTFLTPVFTFGLVPLLDLVVGGDDRNPTEEEMETLARRFGFRLVLYVYVPVQVALVLWGAYAVTHWSLTVFETIGLILSIGITTGGLGITIAHELFHKRSALEKTLGKVLLLTVSYMHFYIEHLIGHHVNVCTPKDPATARYGESFYKFFPRTFFGSWRSAWNLEKTRLKKAGHGVWSWHNQMLWFAVLPVGFAVALGLLFGWQAIPYFFAQSFIAVTLLEIVNYLEHYGLERREVSPGRFERVTAAHAWNANHRLTNYFLFKLQRHADHHVHPVRRYQTLRSFKESPQLPTGYPGMVVLALVPPLWRKVMHPRLHAFHQQMTDRGAA